MARIPLAIHCWFIVCVLTTFFVIKFNYGHTVMKNNKILEYQLILNLNYK